LGWFRLTNIFLKIKSLRTEDDAVRLVESGECHLLRAVKTWWNLLMLTNNWSNCTALHEKRPHYRKRHDKLIFLHDNAPSHTLTKWSKITWRHSTRKCYLIPLAHQTWHLLSSVFVDGLRARWVALRFLRRHPKMAWWVVCLERWGIFLTWYTQIVRKMGKMYS